MKYLLDTCIVSYFFKGNANVVSHMEAVDPSDLAISVVTLFEIEFGFKLKNSKQMDILYKRWKLLASTINILEFNDETALVAADIRTQLKQQGQLIGPYDILIAASALEHQIVCITNNISEFSRVKGIKLLDWSNNNT